MKLPSKDECLKWYEEVDTPQNIIKHVLMVNKVANFLANRLSKQFDINIELVDKASLLHDLDKWPCINDETLKHGYETERMLSEKGYPELGYYARQHRADMILNGLGTWEEKIINYADRRVLGDKVVSLDERFDYLSKRYPESREKRDKIKKKFEELEHEIFSLIRYKPEDLYHLIINSL